MATKHLREITKDTILAEFEKSFLKQSSVNKAIRGLSQIGHHLTGGEYFQFLSVEAQKKVSGENHVLLENDKILKYAQVKLETFDAQRLLKTLEIFHDEGVLASINYITK